MAQKDLISLAKLVTLTTTKQDFDFTKSKLKEVMSEKLAACKTSKQKVQILQQVVDGLLLQMPDKAAQQRELKEQLIKVNRAVKWWFIPLYWTALAAMTATLFKALLL